MNSKKKFKLFAGFVIASIIVAVLSGYSGTVSSSVERFVSLNYGLSAFIYTFLFVVLTSFSFSVSVMTGAGVLFFSKSEVVTYSMIGIMGSSIIDFYISRKLGKDYVRDYLKKHGGQIKKFEKILEKNPFKTTMILSAIFFVPPAIPNFLGGIMKINLKNYSIATFIGNLPNTTFSVFLVYGIFYSRLNYIYFSITGLIIVTLISLYFYEGEIRDLFSVSFPWMFRKKR